MTFSVSTEQASIIVRCKSCRYVYQSASAVTYVPDSQLRKTGLTVSRVEKETELLLRQRVELIQRFIPRGALLDLGCGVGTFLALMRQGGWMIAGVESTTPAALEAQLHLAPASIATVFREGYWPAGSFDVVTNWGLLYRTYQAAELLRLAAYYCRIDGLLFINTLGDENGAEEYPPLHPNEMTGEFPPQPCSPHALSRMLVRYGFRVERIERETPPSIRPLPFPPGARKHRHATSQNAPALSTIAPSRRRAVTPVRGDEVTTVIARYIP